LVQDSTTIKNNILRQDGAGRSAGKGSRI
jgi:hypothetical protein